MENNNVILVDFKKFHNEEVYQCMDSVRKVVTDGPDMSAVQADLERFTDSSMENFFNNLIQ